MIKYHIHNITAGKYPVEMPADNVRGIWSEDINESQEYNKKEAKETKRFLNQLDHLSSEESEIKARIEKA